MPDHRPRKVLIAGASAGIGKGIARAFAVSGDEVFVGGRDRQRLEKVEREFDSLGQVVVVPGDFSDATLIEKTINSIAPLDILVINYGDTDAAPGFDTSESDWQRLIEANLSGPTRLARVASRDMKARGQGAILFIGSICGHEILGAPIAYNAGKTALRAVVKTMARELGPSGIRVNMISPGNVLFEGGRWEAKRKADPRRVEQMLLANVPLRRFGTPEDIAAAALFLCSDTAAFITGTDLVIDGGQTITI